MRRATTAALAAAVVILPAGTAWAATHASSPSQIVAVAAQATATPTAKHTTGTKHTSAKHTTKAKPTATAVPTRTIQGPSEDMQWGPVQVTLIVKGKKITDVRATAPTERQRSAFINSQAVPWLRQEVLQAQSANIDLISGATMTSEAFVASLQAAMQQAHL